MIHPDEPVAVRLMNTIWADRSGLHDDLASTGGLREWLSATGDAVEGPIGRTDLERFRRLRDALRRLAAFQTDDTRVAAASPTPEVTQAVADVNEAVAQAPTWPLLALRDGELRRRSGGKAELPARRLSALAAQAVELFTGGEGSKLRACYAPGCVLYFVKDHPRREWCSGGCGNRARAARHYARHREAQQR
ncbi:ABATE domain-containing protein [Glycomyces tarimensis]